MRVFLLAFCCFAAHGALADILVPTRTIRAKEVISHQDLVWKQGHMPGAVAQFEEVVGKEARVSLHPGRPIGLNDVAPAAIIDRNQIVTLHFNSGGLEISTEARALDRAAIGEQVRVMNLSSRVTVSGVVSENGTIRVTK